MQGAKYSGIVSSDWSECLSPNGPFDPLGFIYPELKADLATIFAQYTGNTISMEDAIGRVRSLLPGMPTRDQMDAYLDQCFQTYRGVPELVQWCIDRGIFFMINTTGTHAYFQRALAKGLLPDVPLVSANPMLRFDAGGSLYEIWDIHDKPKNTRAVMESLGIPGEKLVVIGDSGGDGPHFQWAAQAGGYLIGSMTKPSLRKYCQSRDVTIDRLFGLTYEPGQSRDPEEELKVNFMDLAGIIKDALGIHE